MATYTDIEGQGKLTTAQIAGTVTITLTPPAGQVGDTYFALEAIRNTNGTYDSSSPILTGTFDNISGISTIAGDQYKFGAVVGADGGSFDYTPDNTIAIGTAYVRGTGGITASIS